MARLWSRYGGYLLGFASQLVFNTFHNRRLHDWEHGDDFELSVGAARAHNRGMVEFCSVDPRLLPTCYVPLADLDRAPALAGEALEEGAAALLVASGCPPGHSPSHIGLDPVWARAEEAGIPIVFLTGRASDDEERRARQAGAAEFLRKPVGREELLRILQKLLDSPQGDDDDDELSGNGR